MPYFYNNYRRSRFGYRRNGYRRRGYTIAKMRYSRFAYGRPGTFGFRGIVGKYKRSPEEKKVIDVATIGSFVTNPTTSGPNVFLLNGVAVGAQYTARIGSKIRMKSVYIRGSIFAHSITPQSSVVRLIVVYDMQANGTTITGQNVLLYGPGGTNADVNSMMNMAFRDRFKIIIDKLFNLEMNGSTTAATAYTKGVNKYRKLNLDVTYGGTDGLPGSINSGSLWLILLGDKAIAGDSEPNFVGMTRVRFVDA